MRTESKHWTLDRRIPIAVIIAIILQIGMALIWATDLDARVGYIEHQSSRYSGNNEKFARIEERLDSIKENVDSIKHQLEQLTYRLLRK